MDNLNLSIGKTINIKRVTRKFPERVKIISIFPARKHVRVESAFGQRFDVPYSEVQPNPHQPKK